MAEESTDNRERLNRQEVSDTIVSLEEEIEQSRQEASTIIREIKSKAAGLARSEIRDRIARASVKAGDAAARGVKKARRQTSRLRATLNRIDGKTGLYVAAVVFAAGSLAMVALAKSQKRKKYFKQVSRKTGAADARPQGERLIGSPLENDKI